MARPAVDDENVLREHLAYEIHYLLLAACRFPTIQGNEAAVYQDSALLHARNLLEFTKPVMPTFGVWISEVGGTRPQQDDLYWPWVNFINARVTHFGPDRLLDVDWPDDDVLGRLANLARLALERIESALPQGSSDMRVAVMGELARLGLAYFDSRDKAVLDRIGYAIDHPLPIQTP